MSRKQQTVQSARRRGRVNATVNCFLAAAALSAVSADAGEPYFEQIVFPGADVFFTSATGISDRGDIVGQYRAPGVNRGFLRNRDGHYRTVDHPGAVATNAWGIDASGRIAGDYRLSPNGLILGFVYDHGLWQTIDCSHSLGSVHTFAFGIGGDWQVVGEYKLPGVPLGAPGRAFLYSGGACMDITPPDAGPGPSVAVAWAINSAGDVAGYYVQGGTTHGWIRRTDGSYETLDYPGAILTNVRGINPQERSAGTFRPAPGQPNQGFYRGAGGEFVPLNYPLAALTRALGINAAGGIVGDYGGADCLVIRCAWVLHRGSGGDQAP
jgi:hypothetical protein